VRTATFALIGVRVGGLSNPAAIRLVARVAPVTLGFILALMAASGQLGRVTMATTSVGARTAYPATTSGGIESVMVAALDTNADTSLVLITRMIRLLVIVLLGPPLVVRLTRGQRQRRTAGLEEGKR